MRVRAANLRVLLTFTRAPSPTEHQASVELYTPHGCEYCSVTDSVICGSRSRQHNRTKNTFNFTKHQNIVPGYDRSAVDRGQIGGHTCIHTVVG